MIKCNVNVIGKVYRPVELKEDRNGNPFVTFGISVELKDKQESKSIDISVASDGEDNSVLSLKSGDRVIGGGSPILIQSMTNTRTEDSEATVRQILALEKAGCEIIRCAVPTMEAAASLAEIKKQIHIPLVADIHFDYRLAIAAIENGADKIRINPGNIGSTERIRAVVETAKAKNIPIRVGVNSGSLEKELVEKYHGVTAEGLAESALDKVHIIEDLGYENLVISIKSSNVPICAEAHRLIAEKTDYPLHIGITEAGGGETAVVKAAAGIGALLLRGIGDTLRVSMTGRSCHVCGHFCRFHTLYSA